MTQENTKEKKINRAITPAGSTPLQIRFDRNVANNLFSFRQYGEDATLIKNVVFYLAMQWQNGHSTADMFNISKLDTENFATAMFYKNYRFLLRPHKSPLQFKNKTPQEVEELKNQWANRNTKTPIWNTLMCNALYTMKAQPLLLTYGGKTPNGSTFSEIETLDFFKSIAKHRASQSGKISYEYELSPTFKRDLARYFIKLDADTYAKLRKSNLQDLYMRLALAKTDNLDNGKESESFCIENISFDFLRDRIGCDYGRFRDNKKHIVQAIEKINVLLGYQFAKLTWKKGEKYENRATIEIFHTKSDLDNITADHRQRFELYTIDTLKYAFIKQNELAKSDIRASNHFKSWLMDLETNYAEKKMAIEEAHTLCFGKEIHADNLYKTYGNLPTIAKGLSTN